MQEWVRPFLMKDIEKTIDQFGSPSYDKSDKEKWLELQKKELEPDVSVYYRLGSMLNHDFGGGLGGPAAEFTEAFGTVLANLPEDVFMKILKTPNVFYIFTGHPGAMVKIFAGDEIEPDKPVRVVVFPYENTFMGYKASMGEIVHELAHVFAGDLYSDGEDVEDRTDELAKSWDFEDEIKAMREYETEYWNPEGVSEEDN